MRQVLRPGALGRPRGIGWRGRWEWGSGWGTHVNPWLIHVNVWQKPLQYCKIISLQLIKINQKKNSLDIFFLFFPFLFKLIKFYIHLTFFIFIFLIPPFLFVFSFWLCLDLSFFNKFIFFFIFGCTTWLEGA